MELREASEKRRHRRVAVVRSAFARKEDAAAEGALQDLSAAGARITFGAAVTHDFKPGDAISVVIDDISDELQGRVTRVDGDEVAVKFDDVAPATEAELARGIAAAIDNDDA